MGRYRILFKISAVGELEAITKKNLRLIVKRIASLTNEPRPPGCQKLSSKKYYRIKQGDYRIVYSVSDKDFTINIAKIGHRREVYCG